ncbi:MAG: hypothetical protein OCD00_03845 [Colwellia sp.]
MKALKTNKLTNAIARSLKIAVAGVFGCSIYLNTALADTSTIIDAIEVEKMTMTSAVNVYKEIQVDFESANKLEEQLNNMLREKAPFDEVALLGKQMISKKLSGISGAVTELDKLLNSTQNISELLDELIQESKEGSNDGRTSKEKRSATAHQLNGVYKSLKYLIENTKDEFDKRELMHSLEVAKTKLLDVKFSSHNLDYASGIKGVRKVFSSLATKLILEKDKLVGTTRDLEELDWILTAGETEYKLGMITTSIEGVLGSVGSYADRKKTRTLSLKLLNRPKKSHIFYNHDDVSFDQLSADIDAGKF